MWRSVSKAAFVKALQRLLPEIRAEHLEPAPAGVRAQAVTRDGSLVDDFLIQETDRVINVGNAPSPAATASLNIGKLIAERLAPGSRDPAWTCMYGSTFRIATHAESRTAPTPSTQLREFSTRVFRHLGVPEADARQAADVLADQRPARNRLARRGPAAHVLRYARLSAGSIRGRGSGSSARRPARRPSTATTAWAWWSGPGPIRSRWIRPRRSARAG